MINLADSTAPYRGLMPYTETDTPYFFGRSTEIVTIMANVEVARLTIFYGPSGVGKTSVLRAGVLYQLQQQAQANFTTMGYAENIPVYFNRWQHDPLTNLTQAIVAAAQAFVIDHGAQTTVQANTSTLVPGEELSQQMSFTTALRLWTNQTNSDLLLVLDQFEEYFLYHSHKSGPGTFAYEFVQAVNTPDLRVNFLLSLREDTLARLDYFKGQIPFLLHNRLSIAHLSYAQGREAISRPLEQYNREHGTAYTIEPALVEAVLDQVARGKVTLGYHGTGLTAAETAGESIEAPYLQLVLSYLWTEEKKLNSTILRKQTLDNLGGARKIVSNHLDDTMAGLSTIHQAIAARFFDRLVTLNGTKIAVSLDELTRHAKTEATEVQKVLEQLQLKRLIRGVSLSTGTTQYEIFHDVLIQGILDWQSRVPWRTAERYLDVGLTDWSEAQKANAAELLLDKGRYLYIWQHRDAFKALTEEVTTFLMRTALYHGEASFIYWLTNLPPACQPQGMQIIRAYAFDEADPIRLTTQHAIIQANSERLLPEPIAAKLRELIWEELIDGQPQVQPAGTTAQQHIHAPNGAKVEAASTLLWALRRQLNRQQLLKIAPVVAKSWLKQHRSQLLIAIGSALVVVVVVLAISVIRESLRGKWVSMPPLFAGPISVAALSPSEANTIYIVTPRGPNLNDGATLLRRRGVGGKWEILSPNFTQSEVQALAVAENAGQIRLYVSLYNVGIIRSDNEGKTWQTINNGLLSFSNSSLIVDQKNPTTLYAGSHLRRGVFSSTDGGDRWQDISGDELFGASIVALTYTNEEEALLAGTDAGQIWRRPSEAEKWTPVSTIPGIGAVNVLVAEPTMGAYVYAGTSNGSVLVSTNGGKNWGFLARIPSVYYITSLVVMPGQPEHVFAATYSIGGYTVLQSVDGGREWEPVDNDQFTREQLKLYIDRQAPSTLYAAGDAGLFETSNDGASWLFSPDIGSPLAAIQRIAISPLVGGSTYTAVGGAIYVSAHIDTGSWQRSQQLTALKVNDIFADPVLTDTAYAAVHLTNKWSIFITTNGGKTWQVTQPPADIPEKYFNYTTGFASAATPHERILYVGTNICGVLASKDGGMQWQTVGHKDCFLHENEPRNVLDLAVDPLVTNRLYVAADKTKIYTTEDQGKSWQVAEPEGIKGSITEIQADRQLSNRVYLIAGSDGFWRSDDSARSWQKFSEGLENQLLVDFVTVPGADETLYVASTNGGVWRSTDGGRRWVSIRENLVTTDVTTLVYDERAKVLYIGSEKDVLYKFNPGSITHLWQQ